MKQLIHLLVDKYCKWRTGKTKATLDWEAWYATNVVYRARTIPDMFQNFKYIIEVDSEKFMSDDQWTWRPCDDAQQYFWPARSLGNNAVWRFERVIWDQWDKCWHINTLGDEDKVFVATNSEKDATMISLKYMS